MYVSSDDQQVSLLECWYVQAEVSTLVVGMSKGCECPVSKRQEREGTPEEWVYPEG